MFSRYKETLFLFFFHPFLVSNYIFHGIFLELENSLNFYMLDHDIGQVYIL